MEAHLWWFTLTYARVVDTLTLGVHIRIHRCARFLFVRRRKRNAAMWQENESGNRADVSSAAMPASLAPSGHRAYSEYRTPPGGLQFDLIAG